MTLAEFRTQFDPILLTTLRTYQASVPKTESAFLQDLVEYPTRLIQGGKRIRPYLASLLYTNLGGELTEEVLRFFTALEFLHLFCLVHDDIIDEGITRHGVPTLHVYTRDRLKTEGRCGDFLHLGNGQAMLIGDLLFHWALDVARIPPGNVHARKRAQQLFSYMIDEVVLGQLLDVDLSTRTHADLAEIEQKMVFKTAGYTFIKPMQIGASLKTSSTRVLRFCDAFGRALGLAFQWQDDLLDIDGDSTQIKKNLFSDLLMRQQTPYTYYIQTQGNATDRALLAHLSGRPLKRKEQEEARALFERTGALEAGRTMVDRYFIEAEKYLAQATFLREPEAFTDLLAQLRHRVS